VVQALGPRARPTHSAHALGPRASAARAPRPLAWSLTGGTRPSDASPTSRHGSGKLRLIAGELPPSAIGQASTVNPLRISCGARTTRYPPQFPLLASTAVGGTNRASTGRHKQPQRQPLGAQGLEAHRDFDKVESDG